MKTKAVFLPLVLPLTAFLLATACGDDPKGVEIKDPYVTTTSNDVAALYFTVRNHDAATETLLGVTTDVTTNAMFHHNQVTGASAQMIEISAVEIPAHGSFTFKPADYHVMLMDIKTPLKEGTVVHVTARFKNAGSKTFDATVRGQGSEPAPTAGGHNH